MHSSDLLLLSLALLLSLWMVRYAGVIIFASIKLLLVGGLVVALVRTTATGSSALEALMASRGDVGSAMTNALALIASPDSGVTRFFTALTSSPEGGLPRKERSRPPAAAERQPPATIVARAQVEG